MKPNKRRSDPPKKKPKPIPTIGTHELARRLLELPNVPVYYRDQEFDTVVWVDSVELKEPDDYVSFQYAELVQTPTDMDSSGRIIPKPHHVSGFRWT